MFSLLAPADLQDPAKLHEKVRAPLEIRQLMRVARSFASFEMNATAAACAPLCFSAGGKLQSEPGKKESQQSAEEMDVEQRRGTVVAAHERAKFVRERTQEGYSLIEAVKLYAQCPSVVDRKRARDQRKAERAARPSRRQRQAAAAPEPAQEPERTRPSQRQRATAAAPQPAKEPPAAAPELAEELAEGQPASADESDEDFGELF